MPEGIIVEEWVMGALDELFDAPGETRACLLAYGLCRAYGTGQPLSNFVSHTRASLRTLKRRWNLIMKNKRVRELLDKVKALSG